MPLERRKIFDQKKKYLISNFENSFELKQNDQTERQHTKKCKTGNFTIGKKKTEENSKRNNFPVKSKITKTQPLTANQR